MDSTALAMATSYIVMILLVVIGIAAILIILNHPTDKTQEPPKKHKYFGPYRYKTGFYARYPHWCPDCKTFVNEDQVYTATELLPGTGIHTVLDGGDDREIEVVRCKQCDSRVLDQPIKPSNLFDSVMTRNPNFAQKDERTKRRLESNFNVAYADFKNERMADEVLSEFLEALKDGDRLERFLAEKNYSLKW